MLHKPDENERVEYIESGVESGKQEEVVALDVEHIGHKPAHGIARGIEHTEHSHHAKHIEEHVRQSGTARLRVGSERRHKRRDSGTNVLPHRQCSSLLESEARNMHIKEHQSDSHSGSRRLHNHRHHSTHQHKEQDGAKRIHRQGGKHGSHHFAHIQLRGRILQKG